MYTRTLTHVHTYTRKHVCVYVHMCRCRNEYTYEQAYVYIYIYTHTHMCLSIYTCTHIHTCVCIIMYTHMSTCTFPDKQRKSFHEFYCGLRPTGLTCWPSPGKGRWASGIRRRGSRTKTELGHDSLSLSLSLALALSIYTHTYTGVYIYKLLCRGTYPLRVFHNMPREEVTRLFPEGILRPPSVSLIGCQYV